MTKKPQTILRAVGRVGLAMAGCKPWRVSASVVWARGLRLRI